VANGRAKPISLKARVQEGPAKELASCVSGFQRTANDYDLLSLLKYHEELREGAQSATIS
jgi:hypothetical protein